MVDSRMVNNNIMNYDKAEHGQMYLYQSQYILPKYHTSYWYMAK